MEIRNNWTIEEVSKIYNTPLLELVAEASNVHKQYQPKNGIFLNTLISVKTGGCSEDCAYCAQSVHNKTTMNDLSFMNIEQVKENALEAKNNGVKRVCLSTSGRELDEKDFNIILTMIKEVQQLDMKVCCTLGLLDEEKALKLKEAGISAYNHNLDTSENFYSNIITTREYSDRIKTLNILQKTGIPYCSGGIIGLGEKTKDRVSMLHTLATMGKHPYNFPINRLVPIEGTPLEKNEIISVYEVIRTIATARILMPKTIIALAAGRISISEEGQALCFLAGANSIFAGSKLLTTPNNSINSDNDMLQTFGLNIIIPS